MIVDLHTHVFPESFRDRREKLVERDATFGELFADPKSRMATAEELVAAMDEDGIDVSVAMGVGWTDPGVAREANDYIIESMARHPGRLVGFAGVNPVWADGGAKEADRCARAGLKGVGELHPDSQRFDLGDASTMAPLVEVALEHGLVLTTHSSEPVGHTYAGKGRTRPEVLWRFIRSFPDATVVCAHWGGGLPFYALMPEVAEALGNVYFDTAASPFLYDERIFAVAGSLVGTDKILLASDFPLIRARRLLSELSRSTLSEPQQRAVAGDNAARLLGL